MIIIGVDPSLTSTGICVMDERGKILESLAIQPDNKGIERLASFRRVFKELISRIRLTNIDIVAFIEGYAFGANNKREALGELGGVMKLSLYYDGVEMVVVPPTVVKQYVTGKGNADKIAMALAVQKQYGHEFPTTDQTDAFALAEIGRAYHGLAPGLTKLRAEIIGGIRNPKPKKRKVKAKE